MEDITAGVKLCALTFSAEENCKPVGGIALRERWDEGNSSFDGFG
jgi:hypothetical protein